MPLPGIAPGCTNADQGLFYARQGRVAPGFLYPFIAARRPT